MDVPDDDKIYREDVVLEAWKRVKANKGAPGVDKQDFEYIKDVIGVDQFLAQVREQLKNQRRFAPIRWPIYSGIGGRNTLEQVADLSGISNLLKFVMSCRSCTSPQANFIAGFIL